VLLDNSLPTGNLKLDLSGTGFSGSNGGIVIPENFYVKIVNLNIIQKDNTNSIPLFRIGGVVDYYDCILTGNVDTKVISESTGEVRIYGVTTLD
jgi:hypothetical protein